MKKIRTRQAVRIAVRRAGYFNHPGYREQKRRDVAFAGELGFWGGLALTVVSGGAALPLTAMFMAPKVIDATLGKKPVAPVVEPPKAKAKPKVKAPAKPKGKVKTPVTTKCPITGKTREPLQTPKVPEQPKKPKPKQRKAEPKNHQTKAKEKPLDTSLEARKKRLEKLRRENRGGAADSRLEFFRSVK